MTALDSYLADLDAEQRDEVLEAISDRAFRLATEQVRLVLPLVLSDMMIAARIKAREAGRSDRPQRRKPPRAA